MTKPVNVSDVVSLEVHAVFPARSGSQLSPTSPAVVTAAFVPCVALLSKKSQFVDTEE